MTFTTVLVGLGKIGYSYDADIDDSNVVLTHFKAIRESTTFSCVAIVETNAKKYQELDEEFGSLIYTDLKEIKVSKQIDLVVVATPSETHLEVVKAALKLRPRVILLEKPVSNSLSDALEIFDSTLESGVQIFLNYQRNYHYELRKLALDISQGKVQGPFVFTGWFNNGWINNCSHLFALYLGLFTTGFEDLKISANNDDLLAWNTYNCSAQFINLKDFDGSFFSFELIGKNKTYRYDSHFDSLRISELTKGKLFPNEESLAFPGESIEMNQGNLLPEVYIQLENYLNGDNFFTFSLENGVRIVKLMSDLIQERENDGRPLGIQEA
jgi:hypothetical protein